MNSKDILIAEIIFTHVDAPIWDECKSIAWGIYAAHVKPLEDALAKCEAESQKRLAHCRFEFDKAENAIAELTAAKERERVLVEALMECVDVMETTDDANMQKAIIEALKQARAALASVKEAPCPKN